MRLGLRDPPRMQLPLELVYALSVNIDNLRTWEWNAIDLMWTTKSGPVVRRGRGQQGFKTPWRHHLS